MLRATTLLFFSSPVFAHPGHGALAVHWHFGDLVWVALGAAVLVGVGFLIKKILKR